MTSVVPSPPSIMVPMQFFHLSESQQQKIDALCEYKMKQRSHKQDTCGSSIENERPCDSSEPSPTAQPAKKKPQRSARPAPRKPKSASKSNTNNNNTNSDEKTNGATNTNNNSPKHSQAGNEPGVADDEINETDAHLFVAATLDDFVMEVKGTSSDQQHRRTHSQQSRSNNFYSREDTETDLDCTHADNSLACSTLPSPSSTSFNPAAVPRPVSPMGQLEPSMASAAVSTTSSGAAKKRRRRKNVVPFSVQCMRLTQQWTLATTHWSEPQQQSASSDMAAAAEDELQPLKSMAMPRLNSDRMDTVLPAWSWLTNHLTSVCFSSDSVQPLSKPPKKGAKKLDFKAALIRGRSTSSVGTPRVQQPPLARKRGMCIFPCHLAEHIALSEALSSLPTADAKSPNSSAFSAPPPPSASYFMTRVDIDLRIVAARTPAPEESNCSVQAERCRRLMCALDSIALNGECSAADVRAILNDALIALLSRAPTLVPVCADSGSDEATTTPTTDQPLGDDVMPTPVGLSVEANLDNTTDDASDLKLTIIVTSRARASMKDVSEELRCAVVYDILTSIFPESFALSPHVRSVHWGPAGAQTSDEAREWIELPMSVLRQYCQMSSNKMGDFSRIAEAPDTFTINVNGCNNINGNAGRHTDCNSNHNKDTDANGLTLTQTAGQLHNDDCSPPAESPCGQNNNNDDEVAREDCEAAEEVPATSNNKDTPAVEVGDAEEEETECSSSAPHHHEEKTRTWNINHETLGLTRMVQQLRGILKQRSTLLSELHSAYGVDCAAELSNTTGSTHQKGARAKGHASHSTRRVYTELPFVCVDALTSSGSLAKEFEAYYRMLCQVTAHSLGTCEEPSPTHQAPLLLDAQPWMRQCIQPVLTALENTIRQKAARIVEPHSGNNNNHNAPHSTVIGAQLASKPNRGTTLLPALRSLRAGTQADSDVVASDGAVAMVDAANAPLFTEAVAEAESHLRSFIMAHQGINAKITFHHRVVWPKLWVPSLQQRLARLTEESAERKQVNNTFLLEHQEILSRISNNNNSRNDPLVDTDVPSNMDTPTHTTTAGGSIIDVDVPIVLEGSTTSAPSVDVTAAWDTPIPRVGSANKNNNNKKKSSVVNSGSTSSTDKQQQQQQQHTVSRKLLGATGSSASNTKANNASINRAKKAAVTKNNSIVGPTTSSNMSSAVRANTNNRTAAMRKGSISSNPALSPIRKEGKGAEPASGQQPRQMLDASSTAALCFVVVGAILLVFLALV